MSLVASLPGRPLTDGEIASLNRADAVELAVAVDSETASEAAEANAAADGAEGLLLATDAWVKGLDFLGGAWEVVETVPIDGEGDRYDALRACEDAVRANRERE
ncbi:hypothetical protein Hbl1158_12035 [Halobaculum sp. CBA1158]|uniref:hypothetical protein n=1 Tax=Halobaculum sp. CBA1158 TaxID=2904243 RepID=UPI001F2F022A|nr:hypothetical protein [Halobaculum sp. CBA1158]UIO99255.1 hypothetical protein Hbl1158_12035 [Halobaculum sp. CBA1158]